jgi:hypothetical protein
MPRPTLKPKRPVPPEPNLRALSSKLLRHTFLMGEKFTKKEKMSLGNEIKNTAIRIVRVAILIDGYHNRDRRFELYLKIDEELKLLCELIPIAYHRRCITQQNRDAWVKMALDIDNIAMGQVLKMDKEKKGREKPARRV